MSQKAKHVLVRYSDKFGNTIELHNNVAEELGHVWFGKMGSPLADRWVQAIESQIAAGVGSYLFVVKREGGSYIFHKGEIIEIRRVAKEAVFEDTGLPNYYLSNRLNAQMSCYFKTKILTRCRRQEVATLKLTSSGATALDTLVASMAGLFIIQMD